MGVAYSLKKRKVANAPPCNNCYRKILGNLRMGRKHELGCGLGKKPGILGGTRNIEERDEYLPKKKQLRLRDATYAEVVKAGSDG